MRYSAHDFESSLSTCKSVVACLSACLFVVLFSYRLPWVGTKCERCNVFLYRQFTHASHFLPTMGSQLERNLFLAEAFRAVGSYTLNLLSACRKLCTATLEVLRFLDGDMAMAFWISMTNVSVQGLYERQVCEDPPETDATHAVCSLYCCVTGNFLAPLVPYAVHRVIWVRCYQLLHR